MSPPNQLFLNDMELEIKSLTDIGKRKENQDYLLSKKIADNYLFVVADGLGAHSRSDLASKYFSEAMGSHLNSYAPIINKDPIRGIQSLIRASTHSMAEHLIKENQSDALTTCTVAYLNDKISIFAHVGDSRIYRIEDGKIKWRTIDHSMGQELISAGMLSETQLNTHPARNMLTKCLGIDKVVLADISIQDPLQPNEAVLLCSDGFWEDMTEQDVEKFYFSKRLQTSLATYVKKLHKTVPELDNATAIFVRNAASKPKK